MVRDLHDRIRDCVIDCALHRSKGVSREAVTLAIASMTPSEVLTLHALSKLQATKDDAIRAYFHKHGLL